MARMKDFPKVDMPREKLEKYGPEKIRDHELLAILFGSGIKGLNVLELSKRVLRKVEKVGIEKISFKDLVEERGLGKAKALQVIALLELGKRLTTKERPEILSPEDVWKLCTDFRESKKEHFVAFYLDTQGKVIERQIVSIGILDASLVHPREVFEPAVSLHAASVIVAHNHPSGSLEPSAEDAEITKRLVHAGKILGIELADHVIVSEKSFTSAKKSGIIP